MRSIVNQDRFLGTLLGLAIGDALGMPFSGLSGDQIMACAGYVDRYHSRTLDDGVEVKPGEFTDESEIALCIVESLTTNQGELDADNIGARLLFLARGESRRWMSDDTLTTIDLAETTMDFRVPIDEDGPATGDVAARGVPIGLLHSIGAFDPEPLRADAELVTRLTHGSPAAIAGTTAVAFGVQLAAKGAPHAIAWARETAAFLGSGELADRLLLATELANSDVGANEALSRIGLSAAMPDAVASAFYVAMTSNSFEDAIFMAVNAGGATDTRGALVGALKGTEVGANGIPQRLIDGLESRIYVSLAAPWFHKVALRRRGAVIDLRPTREGE
ncbi:MAG: ADP-ribosylglycohydrolase family protein [Thermomicrobiales bacterium]